MQSRMLHDALFGPCGGVADKPEALKAGLNISQSRNTRFMLPAITRPMPDERHERFHSRPLQLWFVQVFR